MPRPLPALFIFA